MSRTCRWMLCFVVVIAATAMASAQSLGDVARQERAKQKPQSAKVITNDDIPSVDTPNSAAPTEKEDSAGDAKEGKSLSADEKIKEMQQWKDKIAAQDAKVKDLDREINLMERERKLREAVFYSDAGLRIRDEKKWGEDDRKYRDDLAARQKALGAERTKLDDMKTAARKAGVGGVD